MNEQINSNHDCIIKSRNNALLTGVKEVVAFDENGVDLITELGALNIRGDNIKIASFNTQTGDMELNCNKFNALYYINSSSKRENIFSKIFK